MYFERSRIVGLKDTPAALITGTVCDREEVKKYIVASPPLITFPFVLRSQRQWEEFS